MRGEEEDVLNSRLTQFVVGGPMACRVVYALAVAFIAVGVKMTVFGGWLVLTGPGLGERLFGGPVVALAGAGIVFLGGEGAWRMVEGFVPSGRLRSVCRTILVLAVVGAFVMATSQYL